MAVSKGRYDREEDLRLDSAPRGSGNPFDVLRGRIESLEREMQDAERAWADHMEGLASELERANRRLEEATAREEGAQRKLASLREILTKGE